MDVSGGVLCGADDDFFLPFSHRWPVNFSRKTSMCEYPTNFRVQLHLWVDSSQRHGHHHHHHQMESEIAANINNYESLSARGS
jgi:hypothetical protein